MNVDTPLLNQPTGKGKTPWNEQKTNTKRGESKETRNLKVTGGPKETGSDVQDQGTGTNCLSYAVATALRATLNWKKKEDETIDVPKHEVLQNKFDEILTPSARNCGQICFPFGELQRDLSDLGIEIFNINTKDKLLKAIDEKESQGVNVVICFWANSRTKSAFFYFGTPGSPGHELGPSHLKTKTVKCSNCSAISHIPVGASKFTCGKCGLSMSKTSTNINLHNIPRPYVPPLFPYDFDINEDDGNWDGNGHAMYISSRGIYSVEDYKGKRGTPYIEIKNSSGAGWGNEGYVKIREDIITNILPLPNLTDTTSCQLGCNLLGMTLSNLKPSEPTAWAFIGFRPINYKKQGGFKKSRRKTKRKSRKTKRKTKRKTRRKRKYRKKRTKKT
jgi:ribosomal protein S27AE